MPILSHLLVLLVIARILVPPCMCLCRMEAPAARAVAWVLGAEKPNLPPEPPDHEHLPGCPASYLSLGLGLKPLPFAEPLPLALTLPTFTPSLLESTLVVRPTALSVDFPASPPLYVSHCALTV